MKNQVGKISIPVYEIKAELNSGLCRKFAIRRLPTVLILVKKEVAYHETGTHTDRQIIEALNKE
jgi:hypothetical protein